MRLELQLLKISINEQINLFNLESLAEREMIHGA
jgi:hypothetical protein